MDQGENGEKKRGLPLQSEHDDDECDYYHGHDGHDNDGNDNNDGRMTMMPNIMVMTMKLN
jgi:hypothetical protein